ncbi:hypothetical protein PP175_18800 [Aneurinibacillus sp. Ricciae_BoGa-3]|uniref:hypothetical protein n=1 Tax=Aneurinibacillus sp. Ricciae_BoGa-3 TaxID=3022697 RepID=UPI002340ABBB|nr:hypothetical protein [Aneurinibacillus sp. Ricciae_BoGa-3]WCK53384.1 hypothetical protein PP175_18800 [Aneurinibacillus sp. Ricciae_BoGa-3]
MKRSKGVHSMPPSIRFINLTRDLNELIQVSHLLFSHGKSPVIHMSVIPLNDYRQWETQVRSRSDSMHTHQGRSAEFHSYCMDAGRIFFFDCNESIFHKLNDEDIFFRRKQPVIFADKEVLGFLEIFTRSERMLLNFPCC